VRGRITKERASPLRKTNIDLEDAGEEARLGDDQGAMEKKRGRRACIRRVLAGERSEWRRG
jgi:hypothetical protein